MNAMRQFFCVVLTSLFFFSCGNGAKEKPQLTADEVQQSDHVEVIYFHGAQRCVTCLAIESNTKSLLDSLYNRELASGKLVYKVIDLSKKESEPIADKYEVTWSSLFVNRWKAGKEEIHNLTEFSFTNVKGNPDAFKTGVKNQIDELLK